MIRFYSKIIVEQSKDGWLAWIQDLPDSKFSGETPHHAMGRLIARFGEDQFQSAEISAVDHVVIEGHLEYMIPLRNYCRVPVLPQIEVLPQIDKSIETHEVPFRLSSTRRLPAVEL